MRKTLVLVVDDDSMVRDLLATYLKEFGIEAVSARDGKEALEIVKNQAIDLVLTDLYMPRMDGLELVKRVKEYNPRIPVAVLSGHGTVQDTVKALNLGAFTFLSKPIRISDIESAVQKGLRLRDLSQGAYQIQQHAKHYSEARIPNFPHSFPSIILSILKDCQWRGFDDDQTLSNLSVVLDEMLMNAQLHGNKGREDRFITLRYSFDPDKFQITIEDEGDGFDTQQVISDLTNLERHQLLERGIFLASILVDDFHYNDRGNAVTLTLMRPSESQDPAPGEAFPYELEAPDQVVQLSDLRHRPGTER